MSLRAAAVLACLFASSSLAWSQDDPWARALRGERVAATTPPTPGVERVVTQTLTVPDPALEADALRVEVPFGWQRHGGIAWSRTTRQGAYRNVEFFHPTTRDGVHLLPDQSFVYPLEVESPGEGRILGGVEVRSPLYTPEQVVLQLIFPRFRTTARAPRVLWITPLPAVAEAARGDGGPDDAGEIVEAYRVRVQHSESGVRVDEEIGFVTRARRRGGVVEWSIRQCHSVKALRGQLDARRVTLRRIAASAVVGEDWFARHAFVQDVFAGRAGPDPMTARQLREAITAEADLLRELHREAWARHVERERRILAAFDEPLVAGLVVDPLH
jgi:hypothetical protein